MPLVDPLSDSLTPLKSSIEDGTRFLAARVLPQPQKLPKAPEQRGRPPLKRHVDASCLVIEYQNEEMTARTWVEVDTDLVLLQEAHSDTDHWAMFRD
jgi:hypothetical protein